MIKRQEVDYAFEGVDSFLKKEEKHRRTCYSEQAAGICIFETEEISHVLYNDFSG